MPIFLNQKFIEAIRKKGSKGYPLFYLFLTFLILTYLDLMFKYINYGILFDPDVIHILLIDFLLANIILILLMLVPKQFRKSIYNLTMIFFILVAFLFSSANINLLLSNNSVYESLNSIYRSFLDNYYNKTLLLLIPVVTLLFRFRFTYSKLKRLSLFVSIILIFVIGTLYLNSSKYNSHVEVNTNLERLVYEDEGNLIFSRLGVNAGFLRSAINLNIHNITYTGSLLSQTESYLGDSKLSNEYTGIYENKNLIVFEVDNLDFVALTPDIMPTTNSLLFTGLNFSNFYPNTSSNFSLYTGLYESSKITNTLEEFAGNDFPSSIARQFRYMNYSTSLIRSYENQDERINQFETNIGYRNIYDSFDYGDIKLTDQELVEKTIDEFIDKNLFYAHIKLTGLTNLNRYTVFPDKFNSLNVPLEIKNYYEQANNVDNAINFVISTLATNGKLNDTVIVIISTGSPEYLSNDYIRANSPDRSSYMIGRAPFIIWDGTEASEIDEPIGSINFTPTIANMFSFSGMKQYIGDDVFKNGNNVVVYNNRSWISNAGFYNSILQEFIISDPIYITDYLDEFIYVTNGKVYKDFAYSRVILEKNYFIQSNI